MKRTIWLFTTLLLAVDPQRVTSQEELEVLRLRTVLQSAIEVMGQAEKLYVEQRKVLDAEKPKHESLMVKLREKYKTQGLELQYDLTLRPIQEVKPAAKPVPEAKK